MAGKHDVYILEVDGEYRARPAVAAVEHGNGITFRNLTPYKVVVHFPSGLLKKTLYPPVLPPAIAQLLQRIRELPPNSKNKNFRFAAHVDGAFTYQAEVETPSGLVPVVGESGPKIIVDP